MSEDHHHEDSYQLVRIKRKWVPEWLFAALASPIDLIAPKWLPFRWILTAKPPPPEPHWEAVPDDKPTDSGETMWRVRWSRKLVVAKEKERMWLYVRHYGGNGTAWNKQAAQRNAETFNEQHRQPWEFRP